MIERFRRQRLIMVLAILGCIGLAGCGNDNNSKSNDGQSHVAAKAKQEDRANVSISPKDSIPEGFPKEIPIIEGSFSQVALSSGGSMTVSYDVKKSFKEVLKVYKDYYKSAGYKDLQETLIEDSYMGSGIAGGKQLVVILSVNTDDSNLTSVTLTYQTPIH